MELPLLADTFLDGTDTPRGGETSMLFGGSNQLLLRFHTFPIRPHNLIFRLRLDRASTAEECGATCGPCNQTGLLPEAVEIRITRPDWDELSATSTIRAGGSPWTNPGPIDPDVSQQISASTQHDGLTTELPFQVSVNLPVDPAWTRDSLSLLLDDPMAPALRWITRNSPCHAEKPLLTAICKAGALCGNGTVDSGEACDDGNTDDGDMCAADCLTTGT